MASIGHFAVALAATRIDGGPGAPKWRSFVFFSALSMAPDADVVAFAVGIPYHHPFGHRGASHALVIGIVAGLVVHAIWRGGRRSLVAGVVVASHGLLDTLTDGGLGIALLWPFTDARYFAPWRPIPVAPIGLGYFSSRGMLVAATETFYFLPIFAWALWPRRAKEE